jgi:hypothetical protein
MYDDDELLPLCQTDYVIYFQRRAKHIPGCLQLAEESVELRKENETLALLRHRRRQQQENLDLKKLIHASLIQNMNDAPQVILFKSTERIYANYLNVFCGWLP